MRLDGGSDWGSVYSCRDKSSVVFRESEDTETSLMKAGSVAVEYVVGLKDSVMEDDIGGRCH